MLANQDWIEAYKELCILINANIPEIKHIDLYYDQLAYEKEEYPFPEHSLFIEFRTDKINTIGLRVQDMMAQIRFIHCFDTLSDTFHGSDNQATALAFMATQRKIHGLLQGKSGNHFGALDRVSLDREQSPEACIAYAQVYNCVIRDYAAMVETTTGDMTTVTGELSNGAAPTPPDLSMYEVEM